METVAKLKQYGGTTGDLKKIVHGVDRIVGIIIFYGDAINSLTVFYKLSGHERSTDHWGTAGGRHRREIRLNENEYIKSLSGHYGLQGNHRVIRSLTLMTNRRTYGPYGTQQGTSFELSLNGCPIVGFHARCGVTLNAIGVYVKVNYNDIRPGNWGARGCGRQKSIRCRCGQLMRVQCSRPWYDYQCGCGRTAWGGCGRRVFYQCECNRFIWMGCKSAGMTGCCCRRALLLQ